MPSPFAWDTPAPPGCPPAQQRLLDDLPPPAEPTLPRLAVTGLVSYARCPRQCYWDVIERRPRPLRPAARIGSLVHGWIEREAAGQGCLLAAEDEPDEWIAELKAAFLASPWARRRPRAVERPFVLSAGRTTVRGRVDAVYDVDVDGPGGGLEIVDFKTGRRPPADDAGAGFQLDLYALAAVDCWGRDPAGLRTTEWYVREGAGVSRDWDAAAVDAVRARLARLLAAVAAGRFGPVPGSYCARCAHVAACPEGQAASAG
jgi:DNA helicase II / ATP-dependent DNA helicase PcrA